MWKGLSCASRSPATISSTAAAAARRAVSSVFKFLSGQWWCQLWRLALLRRLLIAVGDLQQLQITEGVAQDLQRDRQVFLCEAGRDDYAGQARRRRQVATHGIGYIAGGRVCRRRRRAVQDHEGVDIVAIRETFYQLAHGDAAAIQAQEFPVLFGGPLGQRLPLTGRAP